MNALRLNRPLPIPRLCPRHWSGLLVVMCGIDGSGKSTLIARLASGLEVLGHRPFVTCQPSRFIRQSEAFRLSQGGDVDRIDYRALLLMTVGDRLHHCQFELLPRLSRGEVVLCDRYLYSTLANMMVRGRRRERWLYQVAGAILQPDLTVLLDVEPETAIARIESRDGESADAGYVRDMITAYRALARPAGMAVVDSSGPIEHTEAAVWRLLDRLLPPVGDPERGGRE